MEKPTESPFSKVLNAVKLLSVEPYMFFCLFGYTVRLVTYQDFLMDRACRNELAYPDEVCDHLADHKAEQTKSISLGNNLYTGFILMTCLPAVCIVIFIGPWSDKYSRKWPLLLSILGMFLESLCTAFLAINKHIASTYFIVMALFSGLSGGYLVASSSASSYLSDVTDIKSRASRFAVMDFFMAFASVFGTVIGGQMFKEFGYVAVLSLAPAANFAALIYGVVFIKETKPPLDANKRTQIFKDLFTLDNIKQSYRTCVRKRYGNIRLQIWLLVWIETVHRIVIMGTLSILFAFAKKMYNMGVTEYSNANTIFPTVQAILTVVSVPWLSKNLQLHEAAIGLIGVLSLTAKMVLLSVAFSVPSFYFAMLSGALCSISSIAVRARLSKLVSKEEIGRAFSLLGIFTSMSPMIGTVLFLQIYNASIAVFPGLVFTTAAALILPSAIIFMWMTRLPTVFVGDYAKEENNSSQYNTLDEEEKF